MESNIATDKAIALKGKFLCLSLKQITMIWQKLEEKKKLVVLILQIMS